MHSTKNTDAARARPALSVMVKIMVLADIPWRWRWAARQVHTKVEEVEEASKNVKRGRATKRLKSILTTCRVRDASRRPLCFLNPVPHHAVVFSLAPYHGPMTSRCQREQSQLQGLDCRNGQRTAEICVSLGGQSGHGRWKRKGLPKRLLSKADQR